MFVGAHGWSRPLALKYYDGLGVAQDYAGAVKWFRLAAEQGDAKAQSNLGVIYAKGEGVAQDYVLAQMWFNLAAAQGDESAVKNQEMATKLMTPAQVAEAQRLAREWMAKHPSD